MVPFLLSSCGGGAGHSAGSVVTVASPSAATVAVRASRGYGKILVTGSGRTLYLLTSDPRGKSKCTGSCSIVWPPLDVTGSLKAGPGVETSLLSTFERHGGESQVLYDGHALYTFEQDTGAGMVTGQGIRTYGGTWWVVTPSGKAVTTPSKAGG
ncbi:MAG: COG4315 family predicted lipoprotein [Acidimicrobiales bacterium]